MKKILSFNRGKSALILTILILLNFMVFALLRKQAGQQTPLTLSQEIQEMEYVRDGMEIISWSYALLKYFRNNSPNT